ncbi:hypothetical protein Dsin_009237 [Dipteronia sinensis]|uniref:Retrotransposon gag domain-containing protein n=1 Tax=Dipteronia sinensis TaxID=43782 RepID=A0AAE0AQM5_9ROSI|nr:hypothetical protein Dsin_009237 [Dipteronia sinensis]
MPQRRTRQQMCEVEMNDSRHSRYMHGYLKRLEERILGGTTLKLFNKLKSSSIHNFSQMCREFITRFRGARPSERKPNVLRDVKQGESETLKKYVEKFHKETFGQKTTPKLMLHFIEIEKQLKLKKTTEKEENQEERNGRPMVIGGIPRL